MMRENLESEGVGFVWNLLKALLACRSLVGKIQTWGLLLLLLFLLSISIN